MPARDRGWAVFVWWAGACAVGGALAALDPTPLFFGVPVLSGGLLCAVQALLLRVYRVGIGRPWVVAGSLGWLVGSFAQVLWYELLSEVRFPGNGLIVGCLPWAFLGVGQAVVLFAAARPHSFAFPAFRVFASAFGDALIEAVVPLTTRPFHDALGGALGEYGIGAAQSAVLAAILYAAPTGAVLVRYLGPAGVDETRTGARPDALPEAQTAGSTGGRGITLGVAGLLALVGLGLFGAWGVTNVLGCGPGERAVFEEFPRYGGRIPEPRSDLEGASCYVWFVTPDPREEVYAYYEERLRERGWVVEIHHSPTWSSEHATLEAVRDGYRYTVLYEPDVRMPGGRRVRVFVSG